jgi:acyl-CoA thioesterase
MHYTLKELVKQGENSPFYRLLGIEIEEVRENYARLSIEINRKHIQFLGTVHGGVITTLADSAAAWAIYGSGDLEGLPVTVEMKINFLKPVKSGKIFAEAQSVHRGSRIFVSDVEVKNSEGNLIAKSLLTYYLLKKK